ncbi:g8728 [Coccomyxa viridis]|uniref:G8728 protein n=1 Tax=Coccomyxa viridis TaxID=1274662 RepID=A0ABP1G5K1_9CHLO
MNHLIKRRLLYLVPVASTRLYFSNYDAPVKPPACTTVLRSRFSLLRSSSGHGPVHQVSLRIAASSERQASTVQDDKPSTRHLGTSRQLRRDTSDQAVPGKPSPAGANPGTVEELEEVIANNCPVFYFHPAEKYFPCTVQWFLERCELQVIRKGWRRRVLEVVEAVGKLDGERLKRAQEWFEGQKGQRKKFLMLRLPNPRDRAGQPEQLNQIPIYAHVKELTDPQTGRRTALEVNYCKFLAYNGSYKLFGWIYIGEVGAHDGDWEHVTVRLSADASRVLGVYYSAHRHMDGVWRSADDVPRGKDGRILAHIALNGHGSYPTAGFIPRNLLAFNDYTSNQGAVWDPDSLVIVTNSGEGGKLPSVEDRGQELNGSSYPSLGNEPHAPGIQRAIVKEAAPWLEYKGRWGSTVEAPAQQEWFAKAENPLSRSFLKQVLFPLAPGIESIYEPAMEEVEEALDTAKENVDQLQNEAREAMKGMEVSMEKVEQKYNEWKKGRRK